MLEQAKEAGYYDRTKEYISISLAEMAVGKSDKLVEVENQIANCKKHIVRAEKDLKD